MKYTTICKALYDYTAQSDEELTFKEDDILYILDKDEDPDWWKAQLKPASLDQVGPIGLVPANYVDEVRNPCTPGILRMQRLLKWVTRLNLSAQ